MHLKMSAKSRPFCPGEDVLTYCQASNIRHTLECNRIADHSDVVGALPVGAAPTTSSFSTEHLTSIVYAKTTARQDGMRCSLYLEIFYLLQSAQQRNVATVLAPFSIALALSIARIHRFEEQVL